MKQMKGVSYVVFVLTLLMSATGHGQDASFDKQLEDVKAIIYRAPDSAKLALNSIVTNADESDDKATLMKAYRFLGIASDVQSNYTEAMDWYNRSEILALELNDSLMIGNLLMVKGIIHHRLSHYQLALSFYRDAKEIMTAADLKNQLAAVLNNIAVVYREMSLSEEAKRIYLEAIDLAIASRDSLRLAPNYLNLASVLVESNNLDSAEMLTKLSLAIRMRDDSRFHLGPCYQTLASIKLKRQAYDSAQIFMSRAIDNYREFNTTDKLASAYSTLAEIYLRKGEKDSALIYSDSSIVYVVQFPDNPSRLRVYGVRATVLEGREEYEASARYYNKVVQLQDSLYNNEIQSRMLAYRVDEQTERYKQDLENTQRIQGQLEAREQANKLFIISLAIALLSAMLVVVILYRGFTSRKKLLAELSERNKHLKDLIHVQGKTLSVVGHDLRSPISSLINLFEVIIEQKLEQKELEEVIVHGKANLENTLMNLDGLVAWAGSQGVEQSNEQNLVNVSVTVKQTLQLYQLMASAKQINLEVKGPDNLEAYVYDGDLGVIIRNVVNNALKFTAEEGSVWIRYDRKGDHAEIHIEDNGAGMSPDELENIKLGQLGSTEGTDGELGSGMGVSLLLQTVERNSGSIEFESKDGVGTAVTILLPARKP